MEKIIRAAIRSALNPAAIETAIYDSIAAEIEKLNYELLAEAILEDFDVLEILMEEARNVTLPF